MQDYIPVQWNSESLNIEKIQTMIQNDQSVADELEGRPKGVIGYSELTMFAGNAASSGYKGYPNTTYFLNSYNTNDNSKEWKRVVDNWNINPNGLSVTVNTDVNRIIHVELYIPLLVHNNPIPNTTTPSDTAATSQWPIPGFKFVRDGVDISAESLVDTWTSRGTDSLSTSSFYYDCFDVGVTAGSHVYEVMWKSDQGLRLEIWEQMRTTFETEPSAVNEPDQDRFIYHTNFPAAPDQLLDNSNMVGRYNISDYALYSDHPQKYTKTSDGATYAAGDQFYTAAEMWGPSTALDAPFAGAMPTAQLIVTDCGSANTVLLYKEDGVIIQENINADPTT
jgi:hypothetical protein